MKDLTLRLDALDPEAGTALRLIAYFDQLAEGGAGLQAVVRATAAWAGCPACLSDPDRGLRIRVTASGASTPGPVDERPWPQAQVGEGNARLWIERQGAERPLDQLLMERSSSALAAILRRTRGPATTPAPDEEAWVEVALDPASSAHERSTALQRLRLPRSGVHPLALPGDEMRLVTGEPVAWDGRGMRAGVGPGASAAELPEAAHLARLALRLTAEDSEDDPGPRVVFADQAGGLLQLAASVGPDTPKNPDVVVLDDAQLIAPWLLRTLWSFVEQPSVRTAATQLRLHHSTLQDRLVQAQRMLGWDIYVPSGRLRVHLAIVLRRLHRVPLIEQRSREKARNG